MEQKNRKEGESEAVSRKKCIFAASFIKITTTIRYEDRSRR
nr:hypothetical protein [uncultured Prevotella sp.]